MRNPEDEAKTTNLAISKDDDERGYEIHRLDFWCIGRNPEQIKAFRKDPISVGQALDNAIALFTPIITEFVGPVDSLILSSSARIMFNRIYSTHTKTEGRTIHDESRTKELRSLAFEVDNDYRFRSPKLACIPSV